VSLYFPSLWSSLRFNVIYRRRGDQRCETLSGCLSEPRYLRFCGRYLRKVRAWRGGCRFRPPIGRARETNQAKVPTNDLFVYPHNLCSHSYSWLLGPELLNSMLGMTATASMRFIGFDLLWLSARLLDGTRHRLVLFPTSALFQVFAATWENIFQAVRREYGPELYARIEPHIETLQTTPFWSIPGAARLREISTLPVAEK